MVEEIDLIRLQGNEERKVLDLIYEDPVLVKTFLGDKNTVSRIANSIYTAFITLDDEVIGFVLFVDNIRTGKVEIDMGILSKYRNKGYGTQALEMLKDLILENNLNVEIEIKNFNIGAISSVVKNGFVLSHQKDDSNYYVLKEESVLKK